MIEIHTYELRSPTTVDATQWKSEYPQDCAERIVNWVNSHGQEIAGYNPTGDGPLGPDGKQWGVLTLTQGNHVLTVYPGDYVIRNTHGRFTVADAALFESVYHVVARGAIA